MMFNSGANIKGSYPTRVKCNPFWIKCYTCWQNMWERVTNPVGNNKNYAGCSICIEWQDYQNFARWYEVNYIEGYLLDKDKIEVGNRFYSSDYCSFISPQENAELARAVTYKLYSPDGTIKEIYNVSKFCRENNLARSSMIEVVAGRQNSHRGYSLCAV